MTFFVTNLTSSRNQYLLTQNCQKIFHVIFVTILMILWIRIFNNSTTKKVAINRLFEEPYAVYFYIMPQKTLEKPEISKKHNLLLLPLFSSVYVLIRTVGHPISLKLKYWDVCSFLKI